jgi:8-oxo-dGTP diphosphatase
MREPTNNSEKIKSLYTEMPLLAVCVESCVLAFKNGALHVLLCKSAGNALGWSLPGVLLSRGDTLNEAAALLLHQSVQKKEVYMRQLQAISSESPLVEGQGLSVVYMALVSSEDSAPVAYDAEWHKVNALPALHGENEYLVQKAVMELKALLKREPVAFELLPEKSTLTQLQQLYEGVLGMQFDTRNFRKKLLKMEVLTELNEMQANVAHRAARLYKFNKSKYASHAPQEFNFNV